MSFGGQLHLDLRDERAAHADTRALLAERDAEIARLRAALATATRDGWIKGRDAAEQIADRMGRKHFSDFMEKADVIPKEASGAAAATCASIATAIAAITPPTEEEGER